MNRLNHIAIENDVPRLAVENTLMIETEEERINHVVLEKHLVNAIFARAIIDALATGGGKHWKKYRISARRWFDDDEPIDEKEDDERFTFLEVAEILDLNIKKIRDFLAVHDTWQTVQQGEEGEVVGHLRCVACGQYGI